MSRGDAFEAEKAALIRQWVAKHGPLTAAEQREGDEAWQRGLIAGKSAARVENPIVCANVNKVGFRMSGGIGGYREAAAKYPARVIAMSVFASGGIPPREAIEWVTNEAYVESIVFGASSRGNIENTVALIRAFDETRQACSRA